MDIEITREYVSLVRDIDKLGFCGALFCALFFGYKFVGSHELVLKVNADGQTHTYGEEHQWSLYELTFHEELFGPSSSALSLFNVNSSIWSVKEGAFQLKLFIRLQCSGPLENEVPFSVSVDREW